MWGQAHPRPRGAVHLRIIPTRVGTSCEEKNEYRLTRDHPHACGDKAEKAEPTQVIAGSSPRVWGQVSDKNGNVIDSRIIPTRVGTRNGLSGKRTINQDHPHACGDKHTHAPAAPST